MSGESGPGPDGESEPGPGSGAGIDTGRLARTVTLIAFVTAVSLILLADRLAGRLFQVGAVAVGSIGLITAIVAFLISAGAYYDER
jgi:uncharacterized membrane protein